MNWSLNRIKKYLLNNEMSDTQLVSLLKRVSFNFTQNREDIGEYVLNRDLVSAYTSFYLPTNIPKFDFLFDQLPDGIKKKIASSCFYDIGSGPGTYSCAFIEYFDEFKSVNVVDSSHLMLEQAERLISGLYEEDKKKFSYSSVVTNLDGPKTFFFGNSLNEMNSSEFYSLVENYQPETIVFIEPGTSSFFKKAIEIRNFLLKKDFKIIYPCMSQGVCPAEKRKSESGQDWCHQVLRMTHDQSIERLGQLAGLDRKSMPFIAHVYTKEVSEGLSENIRARLFRFLNETKFSFVWEVCLSELEENKIIRVEIMKKSLSKKEIKSLKKESVGISVEFEKQKEISSEYWRIKLLKYPC